MGNPDHVHILHFEVTKINFETQNNFILHIGICKCKNLLYKVDNSASYCLFTMKQSLNFKYILNDHSEDVMLNSFAVTYLANYNPLMIILFLNGQLPSGSIRPVKKAE